jgi:hypothetical protein
LHVHTSEIAFGVTEQQKLDLATVRDRENCLEE